MTEEMFEFPADRMRVVHEIGWAEIEDERVEELFGDRRPLFLCVGSSLPGDPDMVVRDVFALMPYLATELIGEAFKTYSKFGLHRAVTEYVTGLDAEQVGAQMKHLRFLMDHVGGVN